MKTFFATLLSTLVLNAAVAQTLPPLIGPPAPSATPAVPGQKPIVPASPAVPGQKPIGPASPAAPGQTPTVPGTAVPGAPTAPNPANLPGIKFDSLHDFLKAITELGKPKPPTPELFNDTYTKIWEMVGSQYHLPERLKDWSKFRKPAKPITDRASFNEAVEKMLSSLEDEWTGYTPPDAIEKAEQAEKNGIFPVGLELISDAFGEFKVHYVGYGSPAYKTKKIRKGDHIVAINAERIKGKSRHAVEAMLKAKKAEVITVVVEHNGQQEAVPITSTETEPGQVTMRVLPPDKTIIYVRLPDFMGADNIKLLLKAVAAGLAQSDGKAYVLVLDLRGNPGGMFPLALELSQRLLTAGEICTMTSRDDDLVHVAKYQVIPELELAGASREAEETAVIKWMKTCKLYVLVDGSSASCSEVVSGALKDNGRATVIGIERTFGKGVAYNQFTPAVGGSLTITTGHYLTPGKRQPVSTEQPFDVSYIEHPHNLAIEGGITPNILVKDDRSGDAVDPVLIAVVQDVKAHSFEPHHQVAPAPTLLTPTVLIFVAGVTVIFVASLLMCARRGLARKRQLQRRRAPEPRGRQR